ncbi:MAG: DUF2911 domain-containing protein [Thermoflexibacteraceae bacterium]
MLKKIFLWSIILIGLLSMPLWVFAQETTKDSKVVLPYSSPYSTAQQIIGLTAIKIEYYRPSVRGRNIWGEIVPYDKVWRTGANQATTIEFSDDVLLNDKQIKAGKYALYTIPSKKEWTILLNKNADSWGTESYREEDNVVAFKVKPLKDKFEETFKIEIANIEKVTADIFIEWEHIVIPLTIRVELEEKVKQRIINAITYANEDWEVYATCADYCLRNNLFADKVGEWIDKAFQLNPTTFRTNWLKADWLATQGNFQGAIQMAQKALTLGLAERGEKFIYRADLERAIKLWETKQ